MEKPIETAATHSDRRPTRRLALARAAWLGFAALFSIISAIGQARLFGNTTLTPAQVSELRAMGLTPDFYASWGFGWLAVQSVAWSAVALLIFWRKSDDRTAYVLSAMLFAIGTVTAIPTLQAFAEVAPSLGWLVLVVAFVGNVCVFSFFFVFPTAHYVPRWTVFLAVVLSAYNVISSYANLLPSALAGLPGMIEPLFPLFAITAAGSLILAPVYRYRRVSTPVEREQIKWVVFSIVGALLVFAMTALTVGLPGGNPETDISFITVVIQPVGWDGSLALIPVAIGVAILRYRLFDIDVLIRRTATYALLTGMLLLVFVGTVLILQQLFAATTGAGQNELVTVLSTLTIAALFVPLRNRIQNGIDRRFNRHGYDSQRVLANFALAARDETDLDRLSQKLLQAVGETMQPTSLSIRLKPSDRPRKSVQ